MRPYFPADILDFIKPVWQGIEAPKTAIAVWRQIWQIFEDQGANEPLASPRNSHSPEKDRRPPERGGEDANGRNLKKAG